MPLPTLRGARHEGLASRLVVNLLRAPCLASGRSWLGSPVRKELSDLDGMTCSRHSSPSRTQGIVSARAYLVSLCGAGARKKLPPAPAGDLMIHSALQGGLSCGARRAAMRY